MSDPVYRIIDANVNRAREALRVVEEYARFGLNDASLAEAAKTLRHKVAAIGTQAGIGQQVCKSGLPASRDILGDVGRHIKASDEYQRASMADVATASCKRLTEALRAIEEYAKTIDGDLAVGVAEDAERARYEAYELERRIFRVTLAKERFGQVRLYVIITESFCTGDWFATATAALEGGADCLQLREKNLESAELLRRATKLATLCRQRDALLIINDRPDIALLSGAHGVHVGQTDISVAQARRIVSDTMLVGISTHTTEQAREAIKSAPDYIAVGPMFPTETKPQDHIAGPSTLAAIRKLTSLPLIAIGGINNENVRALTQSTSCGACVCSAITSADDVREATLKIRAAIETQTCQQSN